MLRNSKGLTLIELLAALTISTILISAIMMFTHYSNLGAQRITSRETVLSEARLIMNQIVKEARSDLLISTQDATHILKMDIYEYGLKNNVRHYRLTEDYIYFTYDDATNSFSSERFIDGQLTRHTLSEHVHDIDITLTEMDNTRVRIEVDLTMRMPNNQTYTTETVVYTKNPDKNIDATEDFDT